MKTWKIAQNESQMFDSLTKSFEILKTLFDYKEKEAGLKHEVDEKKCAKQRVICSKIIFLKSALLRFCGFPQREAKSGRKLLRHYKTKSDDSLSEL
ncbi:MAG: hypothetical protein IJ558_00515 [Treponema sp.]|nr:hypothetical protein [Treponema sp.]